MKKLKEMSNSRHSGTIGGIILLSVCGSLSLISAPLGAEKVIVTFSAAILYFWYSISENRLGFKKGFLGTALVVWSLFLVSCFALNENFRIFGESVLWLKAGIILSVCGHCAYSLFEEIMYGFLKKIVISLLCFSLILWLYFSLFLFKIYLFGLIGLLFLGIGFHAFVPLLTLLVLAKILFVKEFKSYKKTIVLSLMIPVLIVAIYVLGSNYQINSLNKLKKETQLSLDFKIPDWIKIAQKVKDGSLTEFFIKKELTLQGSDLSSNTNIFTIDGFNGEELHDPLFIVSSFLNKKSNLTDSDRIAVLESKLDGRHTTEERLWSGSNLSIPSLVTAINLYPKERIAYTEKTIYIHNDGNNGSWSNQEALFTFYMPEGSTVTSLSLWVEGKEEQGYLTTKSKAEKAYKTIVGVENRDPAVVNWQEGNRVTLRVFPCNSKEDRIVKIGISSPLQFDSQTDILTYSNISFKGPRVSDTDEDITLVLPTSLFIESEKIRLKKESDETWKYIGPYENNWSLKMKAPLFANSVFKFGKKNYILELNQERLESVEIKDIYLDLDDTWDKDLITQIIKMAGNRNVWFYKNGLIQLKAESKFLDYQLKDVSKSSFNLFPFKEIANPETSLFITNKETKSVLLKELKGIEAFKIENAVPIKTFVLSGLSPYLSSLKELNILRTMKGGLDDLKEVLKKGIFAMDNKNEKTVIIEPSGLKIVETELPILANSNNDHIARIFAYNKVLSTIGKSYFELAKVENTLLEISALGNVVSPVSSLIVLEKATDYQRFDIKKPDNGMPNASFKKSGAVPEPHEWVLIILTILLVAYFLIRN